MKRLNILGAILLTAAMLRGIPGAAQVSAAADVGAFSSYVWRGVTYSNRFVLQPEASVTVPVRRISLTAGMWANVEPARYNGFSDISESGGLDNFDVTEVDWFGEIGVPLAKRATLALGATGYVFPNHAGLTKTSNTVELYGRADLANALNPTASVYHDVGVVSGTYLEGGVSHAFAFGRRTSLTVGTLAGFSAGQDANLDSQGEPQARSFNFEKDGFTHADVWMSADIARGAVTITPTVHVIITGDDATKISKYVPAPVTGEPMPNRADTKLWFGVTLGWAR